MRYKNEKKLINITSTRVLVQVDEVIVPGYEPENHKIALKEMGNPPFLIVMPKSMVVTRNPTPPKEPEIPSDALMLPDDISTYYLQLFRNHQI